jgi:hypothetical protein
MSLVLKKDMKATKNKSSFVKRNYNFRPQPKFAMLASNRSNEFGKTLQNNFKLSKAVLRDGIRIH